MPLPLHPIFLLRPRLQLQVTGQVLAAWVQVPGARAPTASELVRGGLGGGLAANTGIACLARSGGPLKRAVW